MKIHKAGHSLLIKAFVIIAIINVLVYVFSPGIIVFRAVLVVSAICYLLMVNFSVSRTGTSRRTISLSSPLPTGKSWL